MQASSLGRGDEVGKRCRTLEDLSPRSVIEAVAEVRRFAPTDGTLGEAHLDGQASLGVIGHDGALSEEGRPTQEHSHRAPDTDGDHALAPVPAVVIGCLAGEDREVLLRMVVVCGIVDARSFVEREGSGERRTEAHLQAVRRLHIGADIDFVRYEHILCLEDLLPIEVDRSVGIQPLEEEMNRWTLELLCGEGEGAGIVPVTLTDPLDRVLCEAVIGIGELAQADEILLHDTRHRRRMHLGAAVLAEGPATAKGQRIGGEGKGSSLRHHQDKEEKGAAIERTV